MDDLGDPEWWNAAFVSLVAAKDNERACELYSSYGTLIDGKVMPLSQQAFSCVLQAAAQVARLEVCRDVKKQIEWNGRR